MLELISGHLDRTLTPQEMQELGNWIKADPANARLFAREVFIHSRMRDMLVGEQLLRSADQAPQSAEAVTPPPKTSLKKANTFQQRSHPIRNWLIAASVLFAFSMLTWAWWHSRTVPKSTAVTLAKAVDAQWDGTAADIGKPLALGLPYHLKTGCVELSLPSGGVITMEAPADFSLPSSHAVSLDRGKLSVRVPGGGLEINTPAARITDLGTEFGISTDDDGTRVEVFQGKVVTAPATDLTNTVTLVSGQAASVSAGRVTLDPGGAVPQRFVRTLAQEVSQLDLVDLVAGGDGAGHRRGAGIDMNTGDWGERPPSGEIVPDGRYHRVPALPAVDGVFVPDSTRGSAMVDSAGDRYLLPTTYHGSFMPIWAGGPIPFPPPGNAPVSPVLAGTNYSQDGHGLLEMHSNKGLTLDLTVIRRLHPGRSITGFVSLLGNTKSGTDGSPAAASAYVLVDGQLCFKRETFTARDGAISVNVRLPDESRFLTLVVTDGGDSTITFDHVIWADPTLELGPPAKP
jgi:hypothetical protein